MPSNFTPFTRLFCFILILIASLLATNIWSYLLIVLFIVFLIFFLKLPFKSLFSPIKTLRYFFLVILLMNALLSGCGEEPYFVWHFISLSKESLFLGLRICFKTALATLLASIYTSTSTAVEMAGALSLLLRPLTLINLPVEEISLMLSMTLSFIPVMRRECALVIKAQRARGAGFESKKLSDKASALIPLIVPIFISSLTRADELSLSMEARGYKGARGRTVRKMDKLKGRDWAAMLFSLALLICQIIIRKGGSL